MNEKDKSLDDVIQVHWRDRLSFLESAMLEYGSPHVTGSGSNATFQRLDEKDESFDGLIQAYGENPSTTVGSDTASVINLLSDHTREVEVDGIRLVLLEEGMTHDLPPDGISDKLLAAAEKAVVAYRLEPGYACDD